MYYPVGATDPLTAKEGTWQDTVKSTAGALIAVTTDPHLSEVICQVLKLQAIEKGQRVGACNIVSKDYLPGKGIGLRDVVVPLRYYVKAKEKPYIAALIAAGVVFTIFSLGLSVGRSKRRV
ncbi:MAG: hypothetical protein Q8S00_32645 [Deltaproteobacteria bacterium]|nr:hypothetical protein [Deltaproteobacteria bacterium]